MTLTWAELGVSGKQSVRDLWRQANLGKYASQFQTQEPRHGVVLVKVTPAR